MTNTAIQNERDGGIGRITLARSEKRNALSATMMDQLSGAVSSLEADGSVKVILLSGEGSSFCAGADLDWMRAQIVTDREGKIKEAGRLSDMLRVLNACRKPIITYGHGAVYGGGLGLLAVSDIVILHPDTKLSFSETKLGLIPATIGPFVLSKIGTGAARALFLSAEIFDASRAQAIGLAHHIGSAADAEAQAQAMMGNSGTAMAQAKAFIAEFNRDAVDAEIRRSLEALADSWETEAAQKRIAAFLAKGKK